jgi:hypothetical protein
VNDVSNYQQHIHTNLTFKTSYVDLRRHELFLPFSALLFLLWLSFSALSRSLIDLWSSSYIFPSSNVHPSYYFPFPSFYHSTFSLLSLLFPISPIILWSSSSLLSSSNHTISLLSSPSFYQTFLSFLPLSSSLFVLLIPFSEVFFRADFVWVWKITARHRGNVNQS